LESLHMIASSNFFETCHANLHGYRSRSSIPWVSSLPSLLYTLPT
jgi:hypothetical protein